MKKRELEQALRRGFTANAPSSLPEDILSSSVSQKGPVPMKKNNIKPFYKWTATAVASLAVIAVVGALLFKPPAPTVQSPTPSQTAPTTQATDIISTVSLDVNPSVDIQVNQNEEVVAVTPLNDDGVKIIGDMNFEGVSLSEAVNMLLDSMIENGYISEINNSVLVSVDSEDEAEAARLQEKLTGDVQTMLNEFDGAILSQTVTLDPAIEALAAENNISRGKAMLIARIIEMDPTKNFEDLAKLKINDLNLIIKKLALPDVNSSGVASDKAYIGAEAATKAALDHMGFAADAITELECELDYENGTMCYEVEFVYNTVEYEIDVDAVTSTVLEVDEEAAEDDDEDENDDDNDADSEDNDDDGDDDDKVELPANALAEDAVKTIVLNHAGLTVENIVKWSFEADMKDGVAVYDIEFTTASAEFEYTIDPVSGNVLKAEQD